MLLLIDWIITFLFFIKKANPLIHFLKSSYEHIISSIIFPLLISTEKLKFLFFAHFSISSFVNCDCLPICFWTKSSIDLNLDDSLYFLKFLCTSIINLIFELTIVFSISIELNSILFNSSFIGFIFILFNFGLNDMVAGMKLYGGRHK